MGLIVPHYRPTGNLTALPWCAFHWRNLIQRAGRLLRPGGKLVLSMNDNAAVECELLHYLDALEIAA